MIVEKKFYKQDFGKISLEELYRPWVDGLLEKAMTRTKITAADMNVDPESYEEVRSLIGEMNDNGLDISPE